MKFTFNRKAAFLSALTLIWMAVIFLFSAQNGSESSGTSARIVMFFCGIFGYEPSPGAFRTLTFIVRKSAHMTEFGLLSLLWLGTLRSGTDGFRWIYPAAFAASSVFAATDEMHQLFVSDRAGQVTDWMIDSLGALLFLAAAWIISRSAAQKSGAKRLHKS